MALTWLQIGGAGAVMAASTVWGRLIASGYSQRPRDLRELTSLLRTLRTDIAYHRLPLADAFARASGQGREGRALSGLFATAAALLRQPGMTAQTAWTVAIGEHAPHTALRAQDREILATLGYSLGTVGATEQIAYLDAALSLLADREREAAEERGRYERVYQTLGVLAGLLIVIMLI
ncbi:MAG: hypothetical protein ACYCVB_13040 [Bacilli bacterium]